MKLNLIVLCIIGITTLCNAQWQQIGQDIDGEAEGDGPSALSLSSDGNVLAVGAPFGSGNGDASGHVRVYQYNEMEWVQIGQDIDGENINDHSGASVSLSADGNIVAIGAPDNVNGINESGHVRVYQYNGIDWIQMGQDIDGSEEGFGSLGNSVCLSADGNTVAIGNKRNNGNTGHVRVYQYNGVDWVQMGQNIDGVDDYIYFGWSVSLSSDGNIVAAGAPGYSCFNWEGHVRVFQYVGGGWVQIGQDICGEAVEDHSGYSVCLSSNGERVAVDAPYNDGNGNESGHVRIYQYTEGEWVQIGQDIDGEAAGDRSGFKTCLSSDGNIVAVGAYNNDDNGADAGHTRMYQYNGVDWIQIGQDIDGDEGDFLGQTISLSSDGNVFAIGVPRNDLDIGVGQTRVYQMTDVGITEQINTELSIYPNPSSGIINIETEHIESIEVLDTKGQMLLKENTKSKVDLSQQSKGIYFVKVITRNGVIIEKVLLE